jgi:hypothetical protein
MATMQPGPAEDDPTGDIVELWPPQAPQSARRRRDWLALALILVGLAALTGLLVALLTPSGHPTPGRATPPPAPAGKRLDHRSVEREIEQWGYRGVVCNQGVDIPIALHRQFSCRSTDGHAIAVTITTATGDYVWTPLS